MAYPHYAPEFETRLREWVCEQESRKRFAHTERVVEMVTELAEKWSPMDVMLCRTAAWIHDSAKHFPNEDLFQMALDYKLPISPIEAENPMLLHGAVGYARAAEAFGLNDERLRTACTYHTTGSPDMNLTDKLVFLADIIEPERDFPLVKRLRKLSFRNVDEAMLLSVKGTINHLIERNRLIDPRILYLYNALIRAGVRVEDE